MKYLLGIDLGTSSVKVLLVSVEGKVIALEQEGYEVDVPYEEWAEQHPDLWWEATKLVIRRITSLHPDKIVDIVGIGVAGQMHGLVAIDKNFEPVYPAIIWLDNRSSKQVSEIYKTISLDHFHHITLNRLSTGFALPSLLWLRENKINVFNSIYKIMFPKDYIRFKLTGQIATEVSDASSSVAFDTGSRLWSWDIIHKLNLPEEIFPDCHESDEVSGTISQIAAEETGLVAGTPVVYGGGDQPVQNIGNGVVCGEGVACSSIGTSGQVAIFSETPAYDKQFRVHTFCHAAKKGWSIFGATLSAGLSLKWLNNNVLGKPGYNSIDAMAKNSKPGSEGVIFLPYLTGERTPHFNINAKAMFFGLTLKHDHNQIARSVMEGVVFSLKQSLDIFSEMGIGTERIIAAGGGAKSDVWLQIQADVLGKPIQVVQTKEQVCLGAAIIAGVSVGAFISYDKAIESMIRYDKIIYYPNTSLENLYIETYEKYKQLYVNNKDLFCDDTLYKH